MTYINTEVPGARSNREGGRRLSLLWCQFTRIEAESMQDYRPSPSRAVAVVTIDLVM
jgi:hypothetical protein